MSESKEIYFISGLGADASVFQFLKLEGVKKSYIEWIPPYDHESLSDYAHRLRSQILTENPIVVGLSFGGIVAVEIAKQLPNAKVILISSARSRDEIPVYFRLVGKLRLHKLVPTWVLKQAFFVTYWIFGIQDRETKKLFSEILRRTDDQFLRWAIDRVVTWDNADVLPNLVHIHGTADRLLVMRSMHPDYSIEQGGHFMIVNQSDRVSQLLQTILSQADVSVDLQEAVGEEVKQSLESIGTETQANS